MKKPDQLTLFMTITFALFVFSMPEAAAHTGEETADGFLSGFLHPVRGWDHVAAMVAVGLWGSFLKSPGIWVLPITFPLVMTLGGAAGVAGVPMAGVEIGIGLSSVVLGLLILFAVRLPLWSAMAIVGVFAIFHGYAHGSELPAAANPAAFALGFVVSTGILHLAGIGLGLATRLPKGETLVRIVGAGIALAGAGFLLGII